MPTSLSPTTDSIGSYEGRLSELFCAVLCMTVVYNAI